MKILVDGRVLSHNKITGVERYTIEMLNALEKLGLNYEITIPKLKNKITQHFWEHIILPSNTKNYDILYCPGNIAPIIKPKKVKLITTIHDLMFIKYPQYYSRTFVWYYKFCIPKILNLSDKIITISENEKKEIILQYPFVKGKIVSIPCGTPEKFTLISKEEIKYDKKKYILYVGSIKPSKNIRGIYETFIRLIDRIPHNLYIVGQKSSLYKDMKEEKLLQNKIPKDRIKYFDNINDKEIIELYKNAQCFIFPSFYEGFGLPLLEAMSCGCPIVTSNTSSIPEVVEDAAFKHNPTDYDSMVKSILDIINNKDLMISMIEKGLTQAKKFSWKKSAERLMQEFSSVIYK